MPDPTTVTTYRTVRCSSPEEQLAAIANAQELKLDWLASSATPHVYLAVDPAGIARAVAVEFPAPYRPQQPSE